MQQHRLQRTGEAPLAFSGELLSEAENPDPRVKRKFRLALYRTDSGKIVAEFYYWSAYARGEPEVRDAEVFEPGTAAGELQDWFEECMEFDPDDDGRSALIRVVSTKSDSRRKVAGIIEAVTAEFYRCLGVVLDLPMFEERV